MGKDREGIFHPKKGKPSGSFKEDNIIELQNVDAPVRHPNRNAHKGEEIYEGRKTPVIKTGRSVTSVKRSSPKSKRPSFKRSSSISISSLPILSRELLKELATHKSEPSISIYCPTYRQGAEVNEKMNEITWKSALKEVEEQLAQKGIGKHAAAELLQPAYDTLQSLDFNQELSYGLALFLAHGIVSFIQLPFVSQQSITVSSSFELTPILPFWSSPHFFLLVLSKKQAKLFRGDQFSLSPIKLDEMPNGIDDVVHLEEKDDQDLFRTGSSGGGGGANYHGMGAGKPDEKTNIALYFEEVDKTTRQYVLHNENVPLLLAGVEYIFPIYKKVSNYNNLFQEPLIGNYEHENLSTLSQLAREKMNSYFKESGEKAMENYRNQLGHDLSSSNKEEIIKASQYGRVRSLFIRPLQHIWGSYDETKDHLEIHLTRQPNDECLLNRAAVQTWLNGGDVFLLEDDQEQGNEILASFRYPML